MDAALTRAMSPEILQQGLLKTILAKYPYLDAAIIKAYQSLPRHQFVSKFSPDYLQWIEIDEQNLERYADLLYADVPLLLYEHQAGLVSTISQPSFVLSMLQDLDLKAGHRVFELGAGSGWNAGLMGELVGPQGLIVSMEIIPQMAQTAARNIAQFNLPQVRILEGDAMQGYAPHAPYDRGVFTAGARELPAVFFEQLKTGAKLLWVLKIAGYSDLLIVLLKEQDHFRSLKIIPCAFVPVTGTHARDEDPHDYSALISASGLRIYPANTQISASAEQVIKSEMNVLVFN